MYVARDSTAGVLLPSTTPLHKQGAFDMDGMALYRTLLVLSVLLVVIAAWLLIKFLRRSSNGSRVRRYDILSAKQLSSDQAASEDTDDELFGPVRSDDANRLLVPESTPR